HADGARSDGTLDPDPAPSRRGRDAGAHPAGCHAAALHDDPRLHRAVHCGPDGHFGLARHPEDRRHRGLIMVLLLLLALGLIALSVLLALRVAGASDTRRREALEHIDSYGFSATAATADAAHPATSERLASFATAVGGIYSRYARTDREREIRELL